MTQEEKAFLGGTVERRFAKEMLSNDRLRGELVSAAQKAQSAEAEKSLLAHILRIVAAICRFLFGAKGSGHTDGPAQRFIAKNGAELQAIAQAVKKGTSSNELDDMYMGELVEHGTIDRDGVGVFFVKIRDEDGREVELIDAGTDDTLRKALSETEAKIGEELLLSRRAGVSPAWEIQVLSPRDGASEADLDEEEDSSFGMR